MISKKLIYNLLDELHAKSCNVIVSYNAKYKTNI